MARRQEGRVARSPRLGGMIRVTRCWFCASCSFSAKWPGTVRGARSPGNGSVGPMTGGGGATNQGGPGDQGRSDRGEKRREFTTFPFPCLKLGPIFPRGQTPLRRKGDLLTARKGRQQR